MSDTARETVFVCCACGKRSADLYGEQAINPGWDESCMLNAVEAYTDSLVIQGERVVEILDGGMAGPPPPPPPRMRTFEEIMAEPVSPEMLALDGLSDQAWRERIGNAVPSDAAQAIASEMGRTLLLAWSGETFALSAAPVWVRPIAVAMSVAQGGCDQTGLNLGARTSRAEEAARDRAAGAV